MKLTGLHFLLSYGCTRECDHCFVWSSPRQEGAMSLELIRSALDQSAKLDGLEWIFFEGGEPFLYYPLLLAGVRRAADMGFSVGIVSNAYWATGGEEALEWLKPMQGKVQCLSISSDQYHGEEWITKSVRRASTAAESLGLPVDLISIRGPGSFGEGEAGDVRYRGRAAAKLSEQAATRPWAQFNECPYEELRDPGRLHLDPQGNLHICQGVVAGNLFDDSLERICAAYRPEDDPVIGPLLAGGPAELARRHELEHAGRFADACHLCYTARGMLRSRYPRILRPGNVYGENESEPA